MSDLHGHIHAGRHDCGHCDGCKWWQTDPDAEHGHETVGLCLHEELVHFNLQVSGDSGCNRFRPAELHALAVVGGGTGR